MVAKIPPQSPALTGQTGAEAIPGSEKSVRGSVSALPKKKLDSSFELNLSEAAKAQMAPPTPAVNNREQAIKQLNILQGAANNSTMNFLGSHKTRPQSVIDLLA